MKPTILIVEDEAAIRRMIATSLAREGFEVEEAADAAEAERVIGDKLPDLVLLDWMLPGTSGVEYARRLRRRELTRDLAIVMLTARADEGDKLTGFGAGADDYVVKPFSMRELAARIRAVLRRGSGYGADGMLEAAGLRIDPARHRVTAGDAPLKLGPTEFRLLHFLMANPERVFSRSQLLDRVWGSNVHVEERTVDVHIRRLRKALTPHRFDRSIQTVHGMGYRFSKNPS